jgi:uncharacterized protein DUF1996
MKMKLRLALVPLLLVPVGVSVALAQPTSSRAPQAAKVKLAAYPPPSTESSKGLFIVRCLFSHQRQVDPIVVPGPKGTLSGHLHDFFGNRSTDSDSTYTSMIGSQTTCGLLGDTAGYWSPSLVAPNGAIIKPRAMFAYYRNKPVKYGTTTSFPPDFRLIAGGVGTFPNAGWSCEQDASNMVAQPLDCGSALMVLHVRFPNCWDGVRTDSADHRSHVTYAVNDKCSMSYPVKVPELFLHVRFPPGVSGPNYKLSDGTVSPHADFWNTWQQAKLEQLVQDCLRAGKLCGTVTG